MRTGILGGTFNPIHKAHLHIAEATLQCCRLDRVLFLPAAIPPHKTIADEVSFEHRLAMVECAIAANNQFEASDFEARRPGRSFSVDTLDRLREVYPDDNFYFIIGLDSFREITTWKDYRRLFELANIVVANRPGPGSEKMLDLLPVALQNDFCYDEKSLKLRHKSGHELVLVEDTSLDISSTLIRQRIASGASVSDSVPQPVIDYIQQHRLYRND
ncbi:MAG: nicotinate-nicotinamide nucleotide adenylyltransferase [Desulfuromonas sp.]|nr:MAG: nicotinate-nicotinamide nucleotide adenylyltransferase [Desulfuromonas sp.]